MAGQGNERYTPPSTFLPPRELWLHDPVSEGLLPTPTDERGLVDTDALIALMKTTVAPGYDWRSPFTDVHHLQWPDRWYPRDEQSLETPHVFRNLSISKVVVPRIFHNWVHRITEPPVMPDDEVMSYRIDAQRVAVSLFQEVKNSKTAARRTGLDDAGLERLLMRRFDSFSEKFEQAKQIPREFQLLNYERYPLETVEDMLAIGTRLGRFAVIASATNRVKRPIAA